MTYKTIGCAMKVHIRPGNGFQKITDTDITNTFYDVFNDNHACIKRN